MVCMYIHFMCVCTYVYIYIYSTCMVHAHSPKLRARATLQALSKGGADQDASRSPQACSLMLGDCIFTRCNSDD